MTQSAVELQGSRVHTYVIYQLLIYTLVIVMPT